MADAIRVDGLAQFTRDLKKIEADLPKAVRLALNDAMGIVVDYGKARIPKRTGRAAATIRAQSTRTEARVTEGGKRAAYVPWLDFGGRVGRRKAVKRPFISDGRFLFPALHDRGEQIQAAVEAALLGVVEQAGIEVD